VVSAGIRWWNMAAMTTSQATIIVCPMPDDGGGWMDGNVHTLDEIVNSPGVTISSNREAGGYILGPVSATEVTEFQPAGTAGSASPVSNGWDSVIIGVRGQGSTLYIGFEIIINYEGMVSNVDSFIGGTKHRPKPAATNFFKEAELWAGYVKGAAHEIDRITQGRARQYFNYYAQKGLEYAFPRLGMAGKAVGLLKN
jgi:hypothetical protein